MSTALLQKIININPTWHLIAKFHMKQFFLVLTILVSSLYALAQNDSISRNHELKEVVVKATRPLSKFDTDGIITTVTGTPLQTLETANDILGYLPGITNQNGAIEVIGKGQPIIYINGRKLLNISELDHLPASKVKDVKVINNPGARYGGDVNAVIRISTVKELGDGFSLNSRATAGVRHYFYTKEILNMNYRTGGLDIFADVEYDNGKSTGSQHSMQNYWGENERFSTNDRSSIRRYQMLEGKIGMNYSTLSDHLFGAFYQHTYKPARNSVCGSTSFVFNGMKPADADVAQRDDEKYFGNLVDAYYSGSWGSWSVDATFDFLWRKNNMDQIIRKSATDISATILELHDKSNGRMFAGELHFSRPIGNGSLSFGVEYTNTKRTEDFLSDASSITWLNNKIYENNIGAYCQVSQTFGPVMLQGGLRYEHINSKYHENGDKKPEQSGTHNEILPSISIMVPVKQTMFQISYSRKYNRPLYSQLSATVHYVDQYTYETGNPNLKNRFTDNISLNFRYKWLMITASYKHLHNLIITECTEYPMNPDITLLRKINSRNDANSIEVVASASPGFIGNVYYPLFMAGVVSQLYDIDFRGSVKHMNDPMVLVRLNNIFKLPKNFIIYANFSYRNSFESENIRMGSTWQFDLSVAKTFNKHWDVRLAFNDVFNTARKNSMTIYSGMYEFNTIRFNTVRSVELSIGYMFNTAKSKYQGKGAGNNEKERF